MAYFDIAANSITAQPVTAYLQGRAMRMAYEGEKQNQQFQQMQMADWQKQRDFERQAKATELEQKQQEFDQKKLQGQAAALAGIIRQAGNNPDAVAGLRDLTTATGGKFTFDPNKDPKEQQDTLYAKAAEIEMMAGLTPHEVKWGEDERIVGDERLTYRTRDGVAQGEPIARAPRYKPSSPGAGSGGKFMPVIGADGSVLAFGTSTGQLTDTGQDSLRGPEGQAGVTGAVEKTKLNTSMVATLASTAQNFYSVKNKLIRIRDIIAKGPDTNITSELLAKIGPDLQFVRSVIKGQLLDNVIAAKAGGVTFGAMTMGEWQVVGESGSLLNNRREANLRIMDRLISEADISGRSAVSKGKNDDPAFNFPDFNNGGGGGASSDPEEGTTATNKDGKTLIRKGGKWVPQ